MPPPRCAPSRLSNRDLTRDGRKHTQEERGVVRSLLGEKSDRLSANEVGLGVYPNPAAVRDGRPASRLTASPALPQGRVVRGQRAHRLAAPRPARRPVQLHRCVRPRPPAARLPSPSPHHWLPFHFVRGWGAHAHQMRPWDGRPGACGRARWSNCTGHPPASARSLCPPPSRRAAAFDCCSRFQHCRRRRRRQCSHHRRFGARRGSRAVLCAARGSVDLSPSHASLFIALRCPVRALRSCGCRGLRRRRRATAATASSTARQRRNELEQDGLNLQQVAEAGRENA